MTVKAKTVDTIKFTNKFYYYFSISVGRVLALIYCKFAVTPQKKNGNANFK